MSPNSKGALLMVASMVSFTVNDTFLKATDGALPLAQLLAIRGACATILIVALGLWLRGLRLDLGMQAWRMILMRSVTEIGAAYFFLNALLNLPLANVSAILQVLPLTVTFGAYLFFGDPVGWRRMLAILAGLVGVLIILRPGPDGFSIWSLYAVGAVLCVTARDLVTRNMPAHVPSLTVATTNTVTVGVFFGLVSTTQTWAPVTAELWTLILASTIFIIGGYYFSVQVMRVGEISFIAPFRYTSLLTAIILGYFVFGDWPDRATFLGAGIVVGAGLFSFWREYRLSR